jgi:uncharacterized protein YbbC (DUF1343 family)
MPLPVRHGMTLAELAKDMQRRPTPCVFHSGEKYTVKSDASGEIKTVPQGQDAEIDHNFASLTVVPMQNWQRSEFFDQTGLKWVNPSPNLRSLTEAILYPGVALLEMTNVSVGRGTETPFEEFGAGATPATSSVPAIPAWFDGQTVTAYLTARKIPGVIFAPTRFTVAEDANKYPYHGQSIEGVRISVKDRAALDSPELGIEVLSALHHLYPTQFKLEKAAALVADSQTMAALERGDDPRAIAAAWTSSLKLFEDRRRTSSLLYP